MLDRLSRPLPIGRFVSKETETLEGQTISVTNKSGKTQDVRLVCFKCTLLVATTVDQDIPIASVGLLDNGEHRAGWRDPEYRNNDVLGRAFVQMTRKAIERGMAPCTSGYLTSFIHSDNVASNKAFVKQGAVGSSVSIDGKNFNEYKLPVGMFLEVARLEEEKRMAGGFK